MQLQHSCVVPGTAIPGRGWLCDHDAKICLSSFLRMCCTKPGEYSEIAQRQVAMNNFLGVCLFVLLLWDFGVFKACVLLWKFAFSMLGMIKDNCQDERRSGKRANPGITATLKLLNKISLKMFMVSCDSNENYHDKVTVFNDFIVIWTALCRSVF